MTTTKTITPKCYATTSMHIEDTARIELRVSPAPLDNPGFRNYACIVVDEPMATSSLRLFMGDIDKLRELAKVCDTAADELEALKAGKEASWDA